LRRSVRKPIKTLLTTSSKENNMLICPKCGGALAREGKSFLCPQRHCFDIAKSGYVNLLTADRMNSALPGDNKLMVQARKKFLDKGYYKPLADVLCSTALRYAKSGCTVLDAGCGEGYYTEKIAQALEDMNAEILGIDISKFAADYAARRTKAALFAAASVFHLPVGTESCDIVTSLFAPWCGEEVHRVLKRDGVLIMVIPSERHLWQLKCAIYDEPYPNAVKDYALEGFEFLGAEKVGGEIFLPSNEDIKALFSMTPYFYKTGTEGHERLERLENLTTEIGFEVLAYRKA